MVFTPLSLDYVKTFGRNWSDSANDQMIYELYYHLHENPETARPEPIVLASLLGDEVNANFKVVGRTVVDTINGRRIEKLEDVIAALEQTKNAQPQHIIEFLPDHTFECLDRGAAEKANPRILETYGIPKDRRL
jgi:hypothetical protein